MQKANQKWVELLGEPANLAPVVARLLKKEYLEKADGQMLYTVMPTVFRRLAKRLMMLPDKPANASDFTQRSQVLRFQL
jgi:hypothetical protein